VAHDARPGTPPHFLYIGAPRAGSTWLYENLQRHPGVWVPPCKNISYFHPRFQIYRYQRLQKFGKELLTSDDPVVRRWYRRFFLRPIVGDRWYVGLFPPDRIAGEIAESYCSLDRPQIRHLRDVAPSARIIFVLRDPIDRVLSQAKWGLAQRRSRSIEEVADKEFLAYINRPGSQLRSTYSRALDLWEEAFPRDQLLVLFYEQLLADPAEFLGRICDFIGAASAGDTRDQTLTSRVQQTAERPLPEAVVRYAAQVCKDEIDRLADRFGGPALDWQRRARELLG
jgi:hypothetical protein